MIGVVADDITGANDIGVMFSKEGCQTVVASLEGAIPDDGVDVAIIDTDSRLNSPTTAYAKTREAVHRLASRGYKRYFIKTCSVFRGNIGATFDAALDELNTSFACIILGFPKNGRTTVDGVHYVRGVKLEESEFSRDPVHPMSDSVLERILKGQTKRSVASIDWRTVEKGAQAIRDVLDRLRSTANYVIFDVRHQQDLRVVAEAVHDEPILCGSSAIAEELSKFLPRVDTERPRVKPHNHRGVLLVAGSLTPQTKAQVARAQEQGVSSYKIDTLSLFEDETLLKSKTDTLIEKVACHLIQDEDVLIYADHHPDTVERTVRMGEAKGLDRFQVSKRVSAYLASVSEQVLSNAQCSKLIIAGGDTSAAVCSQLNLQSMWVLEEIEPGIPVSVSSNSPMAVVLKSGSFGQEDFLLKAIKKLRNMR